MYVYDAHCHLESLNDDVSLEQRFLAVAATNEDSIKLAKYHKSNSQAKIGIGIHPWYISPILP